MDSCKYHPVVASDYFCEQCQFATCNDCVDHSIGGEAHCFHCNDSLTKRVTEDNVEPFWRRLEAAFKYPLNINAMTMIVGLSVMSLVLPQLPLPWFITGILYIALAGASLNYGFMCLVETSEGNFDAPAFAEAFQGSVSVVFKMFFMLLLLTIGIAAIANYISPGLAIVATILAVIGLPAILISFAHTNSVFESINPMVFLRVMSTIGFPYGVLLIFLMIMMTSIGAVNEFIGQDFGMINQILQSSVSNYYIVVMFHLMGYMLYQYQDRLGFSNVQNADDYPKAEPSDVAMAHISLRLKEGDYEKVDELFVNALELKNDHRELNKRYFEFLYRTERKNGLRLFSDSYLTHLVITAQSDRLSPEFKRIKQILPAFVPKDPAARYAIASHCYALGDNQTAVQLLNGMYKLHPNYENLIPAYHLMRKALLDIPRMAEQAQKCALLIASLEKRAPVEPPQKLAQNKATFDAKDTTPAHVLAEPELTLVEQKAQAPANSTDRELAPIEFKP